MRAPSSLSPLSSSHATCSTQAGKQARRQPGSVRACVTAYCSQFRFVSSSSQYYSFPFQAVRLYAGLDPGIACVVVLAVISLARPRDPAQLAVFSPDLHLGGSQSVREPEYLSTQLLSPLLPGVIVRDNRRTSQPSSTKTRHCTPHSPSHLTTPDWLAYHHRPPTTFSPCTASS